jgi:hypothetical protein
MTYRSPESYNRPTFREIEPLPQWSARIPTNVPYDTFVEVVLQAAEATQHRYTGTLTRDPENNNVASFTRTRFPRNKYGPSPTDELCLAGVQYLASKFDVAIERDVQHSGISRIVLGLYEGQHDTGGRNEPDGPDHSVQEVAAWLGAGFSVRPAEVFSIRIGADGRASFYSEEVAEITFPTAQKQRVYDLGDSMKQERFSVEDFYDQGGRAYMVETQWCQDPDPSTSQ